MIAESLGQRSLFMRSERRKLAKKRYSNATIDIDECDVGLGVFAHRQIRKGEVILTFDGPVIDFAEAKGRGPLECMTLQVGRDKYIDPLPPAVLVNHSCDPNAGIRDDKNLVALRDIQKGEEVRFDYSTTMEEKSFTMGCAGGSPKCRGVVDDFSTLPRSLQEHYVAQGVVMNFIAEQLRPLIQERKETKSRSREFASTLA
jgi:hypothetical protein